MGWIRKFFDFYLDSSIHVVLSFVALVFITGYYLMIDIPGYLIGFLLFASIPGYNFIKYGVEAKKFILVSNRYHKLIQGFSFLLIPFAVYYALYLRPEEIAFLSVLVVLTAVYALPVLPGAQNLRSMGILKIFIIATVWTGATVFLPVFENESAIAWDLVIEGIQRFLLVIALMIPFEIRDMKVDTPELSTLPQRYGIPQTKLIGQILMAIFFLLTFFKDDPVHYEGFTKGIISLLVIYFVGRSRANQHKYFASFFVEAVPLLWLGMIYIVEFLV